MKFSKLLATSAVVLSMATVAFAAPVAPGTKMDKNIVLNSALDSDPSTMDLSRRSDAYSSSIQQDTMEGLVRLIDKDGEYYMAPMEAEKWDISEDGKTYTFHLRENLKWHDGQPVTAGQYVYSIRRSADPKTGCPNSFFLEPIKNFSAVNKGEKPLEELGVTAPDDRTLVIELSDATPTFMSMINQTVYYPQREDKVKEWGEKFGTEAKYYIGNGAFKLAEWVHNNKIVLKKADTYYDKENVYPETINVFIMSDVNTVHNAFQSGQIDFDTAENKEWLDKYKAAGYNYETFVSNAVSFMTFNNKDEGLFKNAKVRKAVSLSVDRELINDVIWGGLRAPSNGWILDSSSINGKNFREQSGKLFEEMYAELEKEGKDVRTLFVEGLKELGLDEDPSKVTIKIDIGNTSSFMRNLGEFLQQSIEQAIGCKVELNTMEWGVFNDKVSRGDYQIGFMGWGAYYADPYDLLSLFTSDYDAVRTGFKNAEFDELIKKAAHETDDAKRAEMLIRAEHILIREESVVAPVVQSRVHRFTKPYVKNLSKLGFATEGDLYIYTDGRK